MTNEATVIAIVLLSAAMALAITGLGNSARRLLGPSVNIVGGDWSGDVACGIYIFLLAGQLAPFFKPPPLAVGGALLTVGVGLSVWQAHRLSKWQLKIGVISLLFFCFTVLLLATRARFFYDAGLYHLGFIRWMAEQGSVFGLANLHSRFGYNSSWLGASALFSSGPIWHFGPVVWCLSGSLLLYAALLGRANWAARRGLFLCSNFSIVALAVLAYYKGLQSIIMLTQTDLPAALLLIHAFAMAIAVLEEPDAQKHDYVQLAAWVAAAATVKLSAMIVGAFAILPLAAWLNGRLPVRQLVLAGAALITLPCIWVTQNIVLSGCLVYPVAATCSDLPWAVPGTAVRTEAAVIGAWARFPGKHLDDPVFHSFDWVHSWAARNHETLVMFIFVPILSLLLYGFGRKWGQVRRDVRPLLIPIIFSAVGAILWFISAPDPRFGAGFVVSLFAIALVAGLSTWPANLATRLAATAILISSTMFVARLISRPQTLNVLQDVPRQTFQIAHLSSGEPIWTPIGSNQCWTTLPCAPHGSFDARQGTVGSYAAFFVK